MARRRGGGGKKRKYKRKGGGKASKSSGGGKKSRRGGWGWKYGRKRSGKKRKTRGKKKKSRSTAAELVISSSLSSAGGGSSSASSESAATSMCKDGNERISVSLDQLKRLISVTQDGKEGAAGTKVKVAKKTRRHGSSRRGSKKRASKKFKMPKGGGKRKRKGSKVKVSKTSSGAALKSDSKTGGPSMSSTQSDKANSVEVGSSGNSPPHTPSFKHIRSITTSLEKAPSAAGLR